MKNIQKNYINESQQVLKAAYNAWANGVELRKSRTRNKNFTYGKQWIDYTSDIEGNPISEAQKFKEMGKEPITNNLMRQMVKSIVGRFRSNAKEDIQTKSSELDDIHSFNQLDELDSRALEEFLISGCCIQRIDNCFHNPCGIKIFNVNFNHFFINAIQDTRAWDCEIVGQLHDLSLTELITRTGAITDRNRAA